MWRFIRRYIGFTRCTMEERIAYRKGFLVSAVLNMVGILVSVFLWRVLFAQESVIQGYDWNQMILYVLIVALLNATLGFDTERKLSKGILDGSIASDLTKPIDFQSMSFFQALGHSLVEGGTALILVVLLAVTLTDLSPYLNPVSMALFAVSLMLAFMLKFCLAYFGGLMCFFTSNGFGVVYLRQVITDVFSGAMLPLAFFPAWFQRLAGVLPFQASVYLPTQIFLGRIEGRGAVRILALQALWVVVMWTLSGLFFHFAVKKITIQGG